MRLAIPSELLPPSIGNQEIRFAEFAELSVQQGHTVIVTKINAKDGQAGTYSGYHDHHAPPGRVLIQQNAA